MMVAIKAKDEKELKQVCKEHKINMWPSTIRWWVENWRYTARYLCISVEDGKQQGGGHACQKSELGSSTIILTTRRRLI